MTFEAFGQRVKELRRAKRMTLRTFAQVMQIQQSEAMLIEAGFLFPVDLAKLARVLGIDAPEIKPDEPEREAV